MTEQKTFTSQCLKKENEFTAANMCKDTVDMRYIPTTKRRCHNTVKLSTVGERSICQFLLTNLEY